MAPPKIMYEHSTYRTGTDTDEYAGHVCGVAGAENMQQNGTGSNTHGLFTGGEQIDLRTYVPVPGMVPVRCKGGTSSVFWFMRACLSAYLAYIHEMCRRAKNRGQKSTYSKLNTCLL